MFIATPIMTCPKGPLLRSAILTVSISATGPSLVRLHRGFLVEVVEDDFGRRTAAFELDHEPHPGAFFTPAKQMFRLSDEDTKLRLLAATGLDGIVVLKFDAERAATTALDFINHDLVGRFGVTGISVGYDFHFGKGRSGTPDILLNQGDRKGFEVHVEPRFTLDGEPVSSSTIRSALADGHIELASKLLGHPWLIAGEA